MMEGLISSAVSGLTAGTCSVCGAHLTSAFGTDMHRKADVMT